MGLDTVELVVAIEQEFEITIPDEAAAKMLTVGDLHAFVVAELKRLGRVGWESVFVFERMRRLICKHLGVEPEAVVPTANFVKDLGAD